MGWDAYAIRPKIDMDWEPLLTPELEASFEQAGVNPWLDGLCIGLLSRATGVPDYDEANGDGELLWSPETVQHANAIARWDIPLAEFQEAQHIEFARRFLNICASQRLGIWFSW